MNFGALRKEAERCWGVPVSLETVEYLWGRFQARYASCDKDMFFEDYEDYVKVYDELTARNTGQPGPRPAPGKRGRYKKWFLRSLEVVSLIGQFRMTHEAGTRIPWRRLSQEWNTQHSGHRLSPDAMKHVYIRNRRECYVFVLESTVRRLENDLATVPSEQAAMLRPFLEKCRAAAQDSDGYLIDVSGSPEKGYAVRIEPRDWAA